MPIVEQKEVESTSKLAKVTQDATLYSHRKEKPPGLSRKPSSQDVLVEPTSRSPWDVPLTEMNTTPTTYNVPPAPTSEVLVNSISRYSDTGFRTSLPSLRTICEP
jgi:hypothetical protein